MHFQQNVCPQLGSILASSNTSIHTEQQQLSKYFENNDIFSVLFFVVVVLVEVVQKPETFCQIKSANYMSIIFIAPNLKETVYFTLLYPFFFTDEYHRG
jgi:predicted Kef-type K+ transport protein